MMVGLSRQRIFVFFLAIGLSLAYFPIDVRAVEESSSPTSTETVRGDTQEEGTVLNNIGQTSQSEGGTSLQLTYGNSEVPIIFPRSTWENNEGLQKLLTWLPEEEHEPPDYRPIERIVVHDLGCPPTSPTCNSDTVDPKVLIQNIYRFHSVTRGWGDIGYNYIIDRQGRIYEGRYGGNGVRAAHVYDDRQCINFNVGSVGILLLGNYTQSSMPDAMQQSLGRLAAWLAVTNNLDLSNTRTTMVWQNPKIDRYCNVLTGGFNGSFTGKALVSHGDIETGNSDKFDLSLINQRALAIKETLSRYVYSTAVATLRYSLENGTKIPYAGEVATGQTQPENTVPSQNIGSAVTSTATSTETISPETPTVTPQPSRLIAINKNQLDLFPVAQKQMINDGTIVKSETRPLTFLLEQGKRKNIVSQTILLARGLNPANAIPVIDRELGRYPIEGLLGYPEGALLGEKTTGDVYTIKDNKRRHVTSAALFNALKFVWSNIRTVSTDELKVQSLGDPLYFPDGTFMKTSSPRVWVLEDAKRRPVASAELFEKRGFRWDAIRTLEDFEVERYPLGMFLAWPDGTLIRGENKPEVYLVKDTGRKEWIQTVEEFESRGYKWENIVSVLPEELADYLVLGINPLTIAKEEAPPTQETTQSSENPIPSSETNPESTTSSSQTSQGPNIRIAIFALTPETQLIMGSSGGTFRVLHNGNVILETKDAKEEFIINYSELSQTGVVHFEPIGEDTILKMVSYDARPPCKDGANWCKDINDNMFRGATEIVYSQNY